MSSLEPALFDALATGFLPPPPAPFASLSLSPSVRASTVPSTASTTTTAMITSVRFGTTSVRGALGTDRGGRSGGGMTGHPELRPPACVFAPWDPRSGPPEPTPFAEADEAAAAEEPEAAEVPDAGAVPEGDDVPEEDGWADTDGAEAVGGAGGTGGTVGMGAVEPAAPEAAPPDCPVDVVPPDPEPAVRLPDLPRAAAAEPAAPTAALRTERSAPRSFSAASSPRLGPEPPNPARPRARRAAPATARPWSRRPEAPARPPSARARGSPR